MDSPLPSICDEVDLEDDARFFCDLINFANRCSGADVSINYEKIANFPVDEQFAAVLDEARATGMVPADMPESFMRQIVRVGEGNVRALQSYQPSAIARTILFFVPEMKEALAELSGRAASSDEDLGWSREVGQLVELRTVPGDHFTMMVGKSAALIAQDLAQLLNGSLTEGGKPRQAAAK